MSWTLTTKSTRALCYTCVGLWLVLSSASLLVNGEYYTSVDSLQKLDGIESSMLQSFRAYSKALQEDLVTIRRFMERIKFEHEMADEDVEDYLGNPINAFTLIERMVRDWSGVHDLLKFEDARGELMDSLTQLKKNSTLPDEGELKGAILGLARLQDIYDLKAEDMANGRGGYGSPLSWRECFEIATTYTDELRADLAISWLKIAFDKLQSSQDTKAIKDYFAIQIKEHLAIANHILGKRENALEHLNDVLAHEPMHPSRLTKKILSKLPFDAAEYLPFKETNYSRNYAELCRGHLNAEALQASRQLKCHLDSERHPFFIISPLRVEPIHVDPPITLYHSILNDEQISNLIQFAAKGKFMRSEIIRSPGQYEASEKRVSQQTWVRPNASPTIALMYRMLGLISGLNATNAEQMQVANYGIGGQYGPHTDFLLLNSSVSGLVGDRIATNMFYLSDVPQGGYTVFPKLNIFLKPVKGAMIMWYNLHKSLVPDFRTLHAGCPVLKGNKRIANIWTHSGYQDIVRPCALQNDAMSK